MTDLAIYLVNCKTVAVAFLNSQKEARALEHLKEREQRGELPLAPEEQVNRGLRNRKQQKGTSASKVLCAF